MSIRETFFGNLKYHLGLWLTDKDCPCWDNGICDIYPNPKCVGWKNCEHNKSAWD